MVAPISLSSGDVFAGDYRVERPLAEGGMGAVYEVEQLSTGKRRALKVMHPTLVPDERSRARFVDEARVGARIRSEHIVEVIAAGVDTPSGIPWLVMELLEGQDLEELVEARGPLPWAEALELLQQLGHGLGAAHAIGVIHRDLKPQNLFVAESRRMGGGRVLKILDFGIARTVDADRTAATVTSAIGSPFWMAPEQAQPGAALRSSTDVWAVGLIAYYVLAGQMYWQAANHPTFNLSALLVEIMTHPIVPPSHRCPSMSPAFDAWFLRCVNRDPVARFPDANSAIAALAAVAGTAASSPGPLASAPRQIAPTAAMTGGPSPAPVHAHASASVPGWAAGPAAPVATARAPSRSIGLGPAALVLGALGIVFALAGLGFAAYFAFARPESSAVSEAPVAPVQPMAPVAPTPVPTPGQSVANPPPTPSNPPAPRQAPTPNPQPPTPSPSPSVDEPRSPRPRPAPGPPPGEATASTGSLPPAVIQGVVRRNRAAVRYCYETELSRDPNLAGRVTVAFEIGPQGRVQSARVEQSDLHNARVEGCVVRQVRRWRFPAPSPSGVVRVRYPFVFRAQ